MNEHYDAVLADLQQMKEDAEAGIRAIKKLMARGSVPAGTASRSQDGESLPNKIVAFLNSNPSRSYGVEEIAQGVGGNLQTVRGALSRAAKDDKVSRPGRGKYKAKTQKAIARESSGD